MQIYVIITIKRGIMKLFIICKDDNENKFDNDNLTVTCGICKGADTRTAIKMLIADYGDEIDEIVYPNCDIVKK